MTTSVGLTHEEHVTATCDVSLVRDKRVLTCHSSATNDKSTLEERVKSVIYV